MIKKIGDIMVKGTHRFKPFTVATYQFTGIENLKDAPEWVQEIGIWQDDHGNIFMPRKYDDLDEPHQHQINKTWMILTCTDYGGLMAMPEVIFHQQYEAIDE
jgi:hypothetical protein